MPIQATNDLYRKCKGTIEKACWNAYRKNPLIPLEEYRSYANEIFMDATASYKETNGACFNTWLTTQLLRLKPYAARCNITTDTTGRPSSIILSLDAADNELEGRQCTLHDIKQSENDVYSNKLSVPEWALSWEQRMENLKPYMGGLSSDAKTLVDDILDGNASKKDENGVPKFERGSRLYSKLTPRQLYVRLYKKRKWSFERVRDARIEIESMLRKWAPCKLPEAGKEVQVQDELF